MPKTRTYSPKRGDIIDTNFDPGAGKKPKLIRPALVLSPVTFNEKLSLALVAPILAKPRGHGFEVALNNTKTHGVVLCQQVKIINYSMHGCCYLDAAPTEIVQAVLDKVQLLVT